MSVACAVRTRATSARLWTRTTITPRYARIATGKTAKVESARRAGETAIVEREVMTRYDRRSFLKALGIGAAVILDRRATAKEPLVSPAPDPELLRVEKEIVPGSTVFWQFSGETELGTHVSHMEHARLYALQVDAPPPGWNIFLRSLHLAIREDVKLADLKRLLGVNNPTNWRVTVHSGEYDLLDAPIAHVFHAWGINTCPLPAGPLVMMPQVAVRPGLPFMVSVHGAPFSLVGPPIIFQALVEGVAVKA